MGTDALVHQWPRTLLSAFPPVVVIPPGGSALAQATLIHGDHLPFRRGSVATPVVQGPAIPGERAGLACKAGYLVPMCLAPERANLMARGLPLNVIATI